MVPHPDNNPQPAHNNTPFQAGILRGALAALPRGVSVTMRIMQVYLVGGAVRDRLLGRAVSERDWVVVGATPEELLQAGYLPVGREFPVFLHPQTREEYALARLERKVAPGYRGFTTRFSPDVTLVEDLQRRDLTINAMAQSTDGEIVDPYGGQADLGARLLRHVSPSFIEDPVRILRVARFAARFAGQGFRIAPETLELMQRMVASGEAQALVAERVWTETERALGEPRPEVFFETLRACGALAVIFPELDALYRRAAAAALAPGDRHRRARHAGACATRPTAAPRDRCASRRWSMTSARRSRRASAGRATTVTRMPACR